MIKKRRRLIIQDLKTKFKFRFKLKTKNNPMVAQLDRLFVWFGSTTHTLGW